MESFVQMHDGQLADQEPWEAPQLVASEVLEATLANVAAGSDGPSGS